MRVFVTLLLWICAPFSPSPFVGGHPTLQCAQTGASFKRRSHTGRSWNLRQGSFTIGAQRFDSHYGGAMYSGIGTTTHWRNVFKRYDWESEKQDCPYSWNVKSGQEIRLCDEQDTRVRLRMNAVQQTDASGKKHTLAGWLHLEVELVDPADSIRMLYAQMYDEYFNAIGQFVSDPNEECKASDPANFVSPTAYQYLPCSAIGAREDKPSQAVYMVHSDDLVDKMLKGSKYLPKEELNRGVHFTWRMNEYWCSRHERITPMVFILTKKNLDNWRSITGEGAHQDGTFTFLKKLSDSWKLYRKIPNYWLHAGWIGAADIKHPERGPLQCNNLVMNGTGFNEELTGEAPWIKNTTKHTVQEEYLHISNQFEVAKEGLNTINGATTCQQNPYFIEEYAQFVGRCKHLMDAEKRTNSSFLQTCNTDANSKEFRGLNVNFQIYKNYTNDLTIYRKETCSLPCRPPKTVEDAIDISNLVDPVRKDKEGFIFGLTHNKRSRLSISKFWRGRKFHGVLCLIVTLFLMPVSNFMSRYYKETFMDYQYHGVHIWFWVHSGASIASLGLLICGQIALGKGIESWGRSQSLYSIAHHSIGWISILVFVLMVILGKLRNAKILWLNVLLRAHSVVGFMLYFFNLLQIGLSTYIPASPSLRRCGREGYPTGISVEMYITMAWTGLDLIFHGFLTVLQMTADRTLGIRRPMYFPILPILSPHSHKDMKRSGFRKVLLALYVILSALFMLVATLHLGLRYQPEICTIGEMSCKAALGCTPLGLAMCKKLKYDICSRKGRKVVFY